MNLAELLKLLHIFFVVVGFGGAIGFHVVMPAAARSSDLTFVRAALRFGNMFDLMALPGFTAAGVLGIILALHQDWDWGENTWLQIGSTLWVLMVLISLAILRPALRRLNELAAKSSGNTVSPELAAEFKKPLQLITPNLLTLLALIVVYLMVAKPGLDIVDVSHYPVAGFG
ncbi:MAG: DUF2269 family protein [Dehalococcoidia bacterium]